MYQEGLNTVVQTKATGAIWNVQADKVSLGKRKQILPENSVAVEQQLEAGLSV